MLTIRDLKMTLGGRVLFENAALQINAGDRVALVGPNGAGKSTLFSIILKTKQPDVGVVERDPWTTVGYLPQEAEALGDETVLDVATGRVEELPRLMVMEPDLLLLDEPTNHLDLLSLLWLQRYLQNYSGALLLISHDRQFMDEIVTQVHEISGNKLVAYTGNYTDYLRQREERYE